MEAFCVRGVVKNGQVLLAKPLDLPEGTVVTVEYEPGDTSESLSGERPYDPEAARRAFLAYALRSDLVEAPDLADKIRSDR